MQRITALLLTIILSIPNFSVWSNINQQRVNTSQFQTVKPNFQLIYSNKAPSMRIRDICEDEQGFLWLATNNGILRYDGIDFIPFCHNTNTNAKLDSAIFTRITYDWTINAIWATRNTGNKIVHINLDDYSITEHEYNVPNNIKANLTSFNVYNDSLFLAAYNKHFYFVNKFNHNVRIAGIIPKTGRNYSFNKIHTYDRKIYINNAGYIYKVTNTDQADQLYTSLLFCDRDKTANSFTIESDSTLIFTCKKVRHQSIPTNPTQIYRYNINQKTCTLLDEIAHTPPMHKGLIAMDNGIWIATMYGLYFYSNADGTKTYHNTRNSNLYEIRLSSIYKLRNQPIIFIGSEDGLIKNDYFASKFHLTDLRQNLSTINYNPFAVHKDVNGTYWIAFSEGLFWRKTGQQAYTKFTSPENLDKDQKNPLKLISSFAEDTIGKILYLSTTKSVYTFNTQTEKLDILIPADKSKEMIRSISLTKDRRTLIIIRKNSVEEYNMKTGSSISHMLPINTTSRFDNDLDGDSLIWLGESNGTIYSFNLKRDRLTKHITINTNDSSSFALSALAISSNEQSRDIWIGSLTNGLFRYTPGINLIQKIDLSSFIINTVPNIQKDKHGKLWIANDFGIVCINPYSNKATEYKNENYALCKRFAKPSCLGYNGEILFTAMNYIIEFDSENENENTYFPPAIIRSYMLSDAINEVSDKLTGIINVVNSDTIIVPPGARTITLNPGVLQYNSPEQQIVSWRLHTDGEWHTTKLNEPIVLSNLTQGTFKLQIKTLNRQGFAAQQNSKTYYIIKEVYFYNNIFFRIAVAISLFILVFIFIISRIKHARKYRMLLQEEVQKQAGQIIKANQELERSQSIIEATNVALTEAKQSLEKQVEERTIQLAAALNKANEISNLKSMFLSNLGHEVRTPLNCIVGFTKLVADPSTSPTEREEFAHLILESTKGMQHLVNDLLDTSRIESGQLRFNIREFNVEIEVNDTYKMLALERKNPNIDFRLDFDKSLHNLMINNDADRLRQVIINIVYNAFKFTEKGFVELRIKRIAPRQLINYNFWPGLALPDSDVILFAIEDTGIGIPDDKKKQVFEPFRKLNANNTIYPGLGLGLNICQNIVKLFGGQIWLYSIYGKGTTFYFTVPIK